MTRFSAVPPTVFTHPRCLDHDPGPGHPESPARLAVLLDRLSRNVEFPLRHTDFAASDALQRVHPREYLDALADLAVRGGGALDPDTVVNAASWDAARAAAGAVLAAVQHAMSGAGNAFAAVRPPGHHALANRAMGFCLLANVVIGALEARALGAQRILIVDWDVHHGNGTQALMEHDPGMRLVSLHQWPAYPGTGAADERGAGNVFNLPRPPGFPPERYLLDLQAGMATATRKWPPDLVIISAGYDSMLGDPLGGFTLEPLHYADLTHFLRRLAPQAPIVAVLEGGYAPERVADGVLATLEALI